MEFDKQNKIERNRAEFGETYTTLPWISAVQAEAAERTRDELLDALAGRVQTCCNQTKLFTQGLSPGCRICGQGNWSCLFVNGICNGHCFYCPTSQTEKSEPSTNNLTFADCRDYLDYVQQFGIKGVGLSGGEPLLTFDRTLKFATVLKKKFGASLYLWMYTNGLLLSAEKLERLRDAGLNEIRFDISADSYNLAQVRLAVGRIAHVTVEIPAIPEDFALLRQKIMELEHGGVNFLNLHQLRLTPHNYKHLIQRNYTYLHGPKVMVLESELTALKLLDFAAENSLSLGVNYCSFIYKNHYQNMGSRKRSANFMCKPFETITETGMIRSISVKGEATELGRLVEIFKGEGLQATLWEMNGSKNRLWLNQALLTHPALLDFSLLVSYSVTAVRSGISYNNFFREIRLSHQRKIAIERQPVVSDIPLSGEDRLRFMQFFAGEGTGVSDRVLAKNRTGAARMFSALGGPWSRIYECERIRPELYEYY